MSRNARHLQYTQPPQVRRGGKGIRDGVCLMCGLWSGSLAGTPLRKEGPRDWDLTDRRWPLETVEQRKEHSSLKVGRSGG